MREQVEITVPSEVEDITVDFYMLVITQRRLAELDTILLTLP